MTRHFLSVHDSHCCPTHGCKYGHENCPVELGTELGLRCEYCDEDEREYPYELKRLTGLTPEEFESLKQDAMAYRKLKTEGKVL